MEAKDLEEIQKQIEAAAKANNFSTRAARLIAEKKTADEVIKRAKKSCGQERNAE